MLALGVINAVVLVDDGGSAKRDRNTSGGISGPAYLVGGAVGRCRGVHGGAGQVQSSLETVSRGNGVRRHSSAVKRMDRVQQVNLERCTHCLSVSDDSSLLGLNPIQVLPFHYPIIAATPSAATFFFNST